MYLLFDLTQQLIRVQVADLGSEQGMAVKELLCGGSLSRVNSERVRQPGAQCCALIAREGATDIILDLMSSSVRVERAVRISRSQVIGFV
jgi:hypothetical protein